jgi:hypothetical protein
MSHFAKVEDGIVAQVIVAEQDYIDTLDGVWIQTSYNTYGNVHFDGLNLPDDGTPLRKNFAGIGYIYDSELDAFYPSRPFTSWTLNETTCFWEPPVEKPDDPETGYYDWDEDKTEWFLITF